MSRGVTDDRLDKMATLQRRMVQAFLESTTVPAPVLRCITMPVRKRKLVQR